MKRQMKNKVPKIRTKRRTSQNARPNRTQPGTTERINRILSSAGLTSRRNADEWLRSGRITLNGAVVTELGTRAVWGKDSIRVDGKEIPNPPPKVYLMLNKPFGYMCALRDPHGRRLVTDLLHGITERVYPVGRLDFDSLGLLLFTNDGEFAYRMTHPSYEVPRTYKVTIEGEITEKAIDQLKNGVMLEDGPSGKSKVSVIHRSKERSIIRMTISQGRSRQVRRMLEAVDFEVIQLMRTGFGVLRLEDLKVGAYRPLKQEEVSALKRMVGLRQGTPENRKPHRSSKNHTQKKRR